MTQTLLESLLSRYQQDPNKEKIKYFTKLAGEPSVSTSKDLVEMAQSIASQLLGEVSKGDRVVIVLPQGPDYISACLACMWVGAIFVPAFVPDTSLKSARLTAMIQDCEPRAIITTAESREKTRQFNLYMVVNTPYQGQKLPDPIPLQGSDIAFLQYTSGTTYQPKGVKISHQNIAAAVAMICEAFNVKRMSRGLTWLPYYHDMGLVAMGFVPLTVKGTVWVTDPAWFVRNPIPFLQAIGRWQIDCVGMPNFALARCLEKATPDMALDLSSLDVLFCGSEPINPQVVAKFHAVFSQYGLSESAWSPTYGMAEATLWISGTPRQSLPNSRHPNSASGFKSGAVMNCGSWKIGQQELRVVCPQTLSQCDPLEPGEIVIKGPHVSPGYWHDVAPNPFETMLETGEGPYFRTGDIGFLDDHHHLYVLGRQHDLLKRKGQSIFISDIDHFLRQLAAPALVLGIGVLPQFSNKELTGIIIVAESRPTPNIVPETLSNWSDKIAAHFQLPVVEFWVVKPKSLPRTSSGKIRQMSGSPDSYVSQVMAKVCRR